jgi:hypothetical protein
MGASVVEQTWTGRDPQPWTRLPREQRDLNADFIVYEHKSRHQTGDGDLFFMEMYGDGLFTIDSQGWGPHHSSMGSRPEMPEIDGAHATEFCETLSRRFLSDGRSKHPQPPLHAVPSSFKPYIFVPLQLSIDDTIIYDSPYAVREFVGLVCRWAVRSRRRIVFKPHPFCDDGTLLRSIDDYAKRWVWVFRSSANVHNLIAGSDGLILINSGVGFAQRQDLARASEEAGHQGRAAAGHVKDESAWSQTPEARRMAQRPDAGLHPRRLGVALLQPEEGVDEEWVREGQTSEVTPLDDGAAAFPADLERSESADVGCGHRSGPRPRLAGLEPRPATRVSRHSRTRRAAPSVPSWFRSIAWRRW